jgi:hypothetical protein
MRRKLRASAHSPAALRTLIVKVVRTQSQRRHRRSGFVLITILASIVVILALVGLTVDTGYLQLIKVRMQTAADAAVLGAVNELKANGPAQVGTAAKADSASNGFTDGVNGVTVTVNKPPLTGFYTGDATAVEVLIHQNAGTYFMSLLGFNSMSVNARAVARRGPGANCLYVLDPSSSGAFSVSGGATVQVNCGVMIDSTSGSALTASGGAHLNATSVNIAGGYSIGGQGTTVSPAPSVNRRVESDPLGYIATPAVGACAQTGYSLSSGNVATISEGVYCSGISVSGGAQLTLRPGTYVLKGGGLTVAGNSTLKGAGVTFYNTAAAGYSYGAVSLAGGATIQLSAPTTGGLAGILFFQDRAISSPVASSIAGGASSFFTGALYFPTSTLTYSGGTDTDYTILVAKKAIFSGGTTLNNDYSSLPNGTPVKGNASLSE